MRGVNDMKLNIIDERHEGSPQPLSIRSKENRMNFLEDIPAAVPSLIDAALAAFDADRDTSRRYLLRASALLRVKCEACADAEGARPSESRGGLLA
jgi:hypothetical protein